MYLLEHIAGLFLVFVAGSVIGIAIGYIILRTIRKKP